jgi:hypothetical protein
MRCLASICYQCCFHYKRICLCEMVARKTRPQTLCFCFSMRNRVTSGHTYIISSLILPCCCVYPKTGESLPLHLRMHHHCSIALLLGSTNTQLPRYILFILCCVNPQVSQDVHFFFSGVQSVTFVEECSERTPGFAASFLRFGGQHISPMLGVSYHTHCIRPSCLVTADPESRCLSTFFYIPHDHLGGSPHTNNLSSF